LLLLLLLLLLLPLLLLLLLLLLLQINGNTTTTGPRTHNSILQLHNTSLPYCNFPAACQIPLHH
jgi:hypothetical protein